ncbi:MAG: nucleotidyltransferase domain-containing protein [Spirochaetales bacterium]
MRVETSEQALAVVKEVCRQFPSIKLALIYGSASRNELRPHSDLDVAVSSGSKMPWEVRGKLLMALEDASGRSVDLVDLETLEGLLWEFLWTDAKFALWDHDLVVRYAGKAQAFVEDVKPGYMKMVGERLRRAFGAS